MRNDQASEPSSLNPTQLGLLAGFGVVCLAFFLQDNPWLILPAVVLAGGGAWYFGKQFYERRWGKSLRAYKEAQATSKETVPEPPTSTNWADHAIYQENLKAPKVPDHSKIIIETKYRLEHELIVAGSGHGKSQLMEWQIIKDLHDPACPALIVIDSKRDMVERLSRLDFFHPDHPKRELIYIDPREHPALNIFDVKTYDEETTNEIISQLSYFLGSLLETDLSASMEIVFRPLCQLMLTIPGANLDTLAAAVRDINQFRSSMDKLPPRTREFLKKDYPNILPTQTKQAVMRRIQLLQQQSPSFDAMLNADRNALNLTDALNTGKVVFISTETAFLKDLSPVFGKLFISLAISAALAGKKRPAYIYVDEAKPYSNERLEELLRTMRSYKLGCVLAYQQFFDLPRTLQVVAKTNTTVKFIGGNDSDASKFFADELRVSPEFIYNQTKDPQERFTRFALHVKNKLDHALSYQFPIGHLDTLPLMDDETYTRMRAKNKQRLTTKPTPPKPSRDMQTGITEN